MAIVPGLIVNPRAGKSSGKGLALAGKLKGDAMPVHVLERFEQLPQAIGDCAAAGVTDLFISSGDGTVHAIQTRLAENGPFPHLPRLCLLPHGTTNMTAADLGFRQHSVDAQAAFIRNPQPTDLQARPTLRAVNPGDGATRHGMFLGAGAVAGATLYCQRAFNARGVMGSWATFATLAGAVVRTVFSAADPDDENRFDRPYPISLAADGRPLCGGTQLLMLATTLEKLILGTRPFWGGASAPIRTTILPYPVPSIARWMLPIMYGGEARKVPPGAISVAARHLEVISGTDFVIDGEFFAGPRDGPLVIEAGPVFTYIRG